MKHILQFLLLLFFTTLWGCGDSGRIPVYPVRGKVTLDGQPAVGAYVIFHPTTKDEKKIGLKPRGVTNDDGEFVLRTYESGDGAPEGDYQVITFWGSPDDLTEEGTVPENWKYIMKKYGRRNKPQFIEEEFQGFSVTPTIAKEIGVHPRNVEVRLLQEAAMVAVGRSHESYVVVMKVHAPTATRRVRRAPIDLVTVLEVSGSGCGCRW